MCTTEPDDLEEMGYQMALPVRLVLDQGSGFCIRDRAIQLRLPRHRCAAPGDPRLRPGNTGHTMTGPEDRRLGLGRALEEFEQLLTKWRLDEQPIDFNYLTHLAIYVKEQS